MKDLLITISKVSNLADEIQSRTKLSRAEAVSQAFKELKKGLNLKTFCLEDHSGKEIS